MPPPQTYVNHYATGKSTASTPRRTNSTHSASTSGNSSSVVNTTASGGVVEGTVRVLGPGSGLDGVRAGEILVTRAGRAP